MDAQTVFRTTRLNGRPPREGDGALYALLFGAQAGATRLAADLQDWDRHRVCPWVLFHAGHPVGVAGFRIGFGDDGLDLSFHFLPELAGQGLASEFVQAALDHAASILKEDRFFASVAPDNAASIRVLQKAGFEAAPAKGGVVRMRLRRGLVMARPPAAPTA